MLMLPAVSPHMHMVRHRHFCPGLILADQTRAESRDSEADVAQSIMTNRINVDEEEDAVALDHTASFMSDMEIQPRASLGVDIDLPFMHPEEEEEEEDDVNDRRGALPFRPDSPKFEVIYLGKLKVCDVAVSTLCEKMMIRCRCVL
jgi:hypothetical protein